MSKLKNKVGRPPLPEGERKTYQRIAIYPETYVVVKKRTTKKNIQIKDYIKQLVDNDNN